ncbi:MAG TPA: DUF5681 domain-containing protein [Paludibacteraceae bacterium]|jgi:hypothetical protein|nr:DUF5681 domain-containing protein [Paludibacteraceae bacterium]
MTESNNALTVKRDNLGRFVSGNSGNPSGRSARKTEHDYLELAKQKCGKSQWLAIVEKAVEQAMQGDARARQWLSDYLIGKPLMRQVTESESERQGKPFVITWTDLGL